MRLEELKVWRRHQHMAVAVVEDEAGMVATVRRLHRMGISNEQISLLALDTQKLHAAIEDIGPFRGQLVQEDETGDEVAEATSPKGREETEGMAVGGCVGLLIGLGVFAIPGLGPLLLAAGPVVMAINVLGHTVAGGVGLGMLLGAIFDERVTEAHRDYYKERLQKGHWLLVVHGDEAAVERVAEVLRGDAVEQVEAF
jgi:hypothetical protein